jgi:hypothetical protein
MDNIKSLLKSLSKEIFAMLAFIIIMGLSDRIKSINLIAKHYAVIIGNVTVRFMNYLFGLRIENITIENSDYHGVYLDLKIVISIIPLLGVLWFIVRPLYRLPPTFFSPPPKFFGFSGMVANQRRPRVLAIGSRMDEAWQILHHLRSRGNPLAVKQNRLAYIYSALKSNEIRSSKSNEMRGLAINILAIAVRHWFPA